MAETSSDDPGYAQKRSGVNKEDLHKEMLQRHRDATDYWNPQYRKSESDMRFAFLPECQWDDWMIQQRGKRPRYTVNKIRQAMKQITNDQRQNRPGPKVRAVEDGDRDLAEVRQGLIRNIDSTSSADRARDTAFQFAVGGGIGFWRISTEYAEDGGFDQVIVKKEIPNPYMVYPDPTAREKDLRDARFYFVDCIWSRSAFKKKWPKAKVVSVDSTIELDRDWWQEREVLVSEYWYKTEEEYELVRLSDGRDVPDDELVGIQDELQAQGVYIAKTRKATRTKVWHTIVSGAEILEGPNEWAGRFIPIVVTWGDVLELDGKLTFCGAVRFGRDAQMMYNYERSQMIEIVAEQGYSPFIMDVNAIEGQERQYETLRITRPPVILYKGNPNLANNGAPTRNPPPDFPAALANMAAISADDIKASTGIYDAALGQRSNETSGRAIIARQREADVANFDYIDNLSFAIKYDFEITNDLIPHIYDTERQIRIIGDDGAEKVIKVNKPILDQQTGQVVTLNDLSEGRFDIAVTIGPSYTTQRMEMAEAMQQLANDPSPLGMIAKYGFLKSLDMPGMDDLLKGARKILVSQGLLEPEEGDEPPQPQQPNPKDVAQAKKDEASALNQQAQAAKNKAEADGQALENVQLSQDMQFRQIAVQGAAQQVAQFAQGPIDLATGQPTGMPLPPGPYTMQ